MTALILGDLLYMTAVGMTMVFLFLKSRLPRRRTALIVYGTTLALMAAEVILTFLIGIGQVVHFYGLIVHLPCLLMTALLSQYRGWRLLFQILSAILFSAMIQQAGGLAYYCSNQQARPLWLTFLILTPAVLWLLHSRICPVVFQVLDELQRGWALICLSLIAYWLIVFYVFPGYKVISHPSLMFEFSNPYSGALRFDEKGLPVSYLQGHGIGSHSIAAFCEKHGASYQYTAENGRFTLQVIL